MCDEINAFDSRASRRTALCASWEATTARTSTSGPIFESTPTRERLSGAPAVQLEGPGAMSMLVRPSLPACFASRDALTHASHRVFSCFLGRRVPTASNASCWPRSKQSAVMVTTIDLAANRTASSGVGGEERASVDGRLDGLGHG